MQGHRFLPTTEQDRHDLLKACGVSNVEELLAGIPADIRYRDLLPGIGKPLSEMEIKKKIDLLMKKSRYKKGGLSFLGAGAYDHFCPAVVNQLTLRGEFLTSYTPYQPEMAQGTLQALYEFQSMMAEIFAMDVSTASHYDGATATAEAALMAMRLKPERKRIVISEGLHPEYNVVLKTYLSNIDAEIVTLPLDTNGTTSQLNTSVYVDETTACVILQSPNFYGCVEDVEKWGEIAHQAGALLTSVVTEPLSLALLKTPGECGADIATGEGQSFGLPQSLGGPFLGVFTSRKEYVRQLPGRLCGETVDARGRRSYTLTLSTREQHIRREKATSNICTNQNLCTLWTTIWLALVGKEGFVEMASQNLAKTEYAKSCIQRDGKAKLRFPHTPTFNEFVVDIPSGSQNFIKKCVEHDLAPGLALQRFFPSDTHGVLVNITEKKSRDDIDLLMEMIRKFA